MPQDGIVCVIGTTGVGKSQLAIDLALSLGRETPAAEVINADSMQVYRGLDVLTNKVTTEEMQGVPHRLLGFIEPGREYQVGHFVKDAVREIERCRAAGQTAIIAGGTAYYVQTLLFPSRQVDTRSVTLSGNECIALMKEHDLLRSRLASLADQQLALLRAIPALPNTPSPSLLPPDFPYELLPTDYRTPESLAEGFFALLEALDPVMARRWHPRDIRKTRRSLEICSQKGRPASEVIAEQDEGDASQASWPTLVFWLRSDDDVLSDRLDKRVDKMVEAGLLDEVKELKCISEASGVGSEDVTSGIYQAIGYREMLGYLLAQSAGEAKATDAVRFAEAVERVKISTRQYAKRQTSWIERRMLPQLASADNVHLCVLDATRLDRWAEEVREPAVATLQAWRAGVDLSQQKAETIATLGQMVTTLGPSANLSSQQFVDCETCTTGTGRPVRVAPSVLQSHLKSKAHRHHASPRTRRPLAPS